MSSDIAFLNRVAEVATAVGWQSGEGASEIAGHIISCLYAAPENLERFMVEGPELFIDGTFSPSNGSLSFRTVRGDIGTPARLRKHLGSQQ